MTPVHSTQDTPRPSRETCGPCDLLQVYRCPCQRPTCRARAIPGTAACVAARDPRRRTGAAPAPRGATP